MHIQLLCWLCLNLKISHAPILYQDKLGSVDPNAALAIWAFIHPAAIDAADEWLVLHHGHKGWGEGVATRKMPTDKMMADLKAYLEDKFKGSIDQPLIVLRQTPGMVIRVPPGWLHWVRNLRACLKIAFDLYKLADLPRVAKAASDITSRVFGATASTDFMAVPRVVKVAASQLLGVA